MRSSLRPPHAPSLYRELAKAIPTKVVHCRRRKTVEPATCLQHGWPRCCGYTMSLDDPAERA